ncbi:MAG: hypothetical protein JOZ39_00560 [Chloroflexi bacterium]|nr:hypothetical protein [Chloroflexota bacterium]
MNDGPIRPGRGPDFYTRLGCGSCLVVVVLNIAFVAAAAVLIGRGLSQRPGLRSALVATVQVANDTAQPVYLQTGSCYFAGCNFGFGRGIPIQAGRSVALPLFPAGTGLFDYRVTDGSGKVLGCANPDSFSSHRIATSDLTTCP